MQAPKVAAMSSVEVIWADEVLRLLPERVVHLPEHGALLLADPHFGKAEHFRSAGIPVPRGTTAATLAAIDHAVMLTRPTRLIVLGDFFHARGGVTAPVLDQLAAWRGTHRGLELTVIRGNHDRHAGDPPASLGVNCNTEAVALGGVVLRHDPADAEPGDGHTIAGHLHPAVRLEGPHSAMKLPCFHLAPRVAVLPAFGRFTGTHPVRVKRGDRVFAVGPDAVLEVTPRRVCESALG